MSAPKEKAPRERRSTKQSQEDSNSQSDESQVIEFKPSWREHYQVHPACAEWPALSPDQRGALKGDLDVNKLKVPIQTREVANDDTKYVIDGYHRLDLMEELGWQIVDKDGKWMGAALGMVEHRLGRTHEQIAVEVNSYNGKRRHMTKQELADAIVATLEKAREMAGKDADLRKTQRSAKRGAGGRLLGSTKDELKETAISQAEAAGSSKHAVQRALGKRKRKADAPAEPRKRKGACFDDAVYGRYEAMMNGKSMGNVCKQWQRTKNDAEQVIRDALCGRERRAK